MFLVNEKIIAQVEVKKSKFIAILTTFNDFKNLQNSLKLEHPKATHIVWAYRFLNDFEQIVENLNDDAEPKNSSAPAILNALRGADLINCACFVVRYFGGVKLGIGGLIRAYGLASNEAINAAKQNNLINLYEKQIKSEIFIPFAFISRFEYFFKKENINFTKEFKADGCLFVLNANEKQNEKFYNFKKEFAL